MATCVRLDPNRAVQVISEQFGLQPGDYLAWCKKSGLALTCEKTRQQLRKELALYKAQCASEDLHKHARKASEYESLLQVIRSGKTGVLSQIEREVIDLNLLERQRLAELITAVEGNNRSKLLQNEETLKVLIRVARKYTSWIAPPSTWKAKIYSLDRQVGSLLRHLFAKYPVPAFMDEAWTDLDSEYSRRSQNWYIHIGSGGNIRTAEGLPIPLTKKMAHYFLKAPDNYTIRDALIYGQVIALGGMERVAGNLRGTKVHLFEDGFRQSFLRFLIDNPMLDAHQYGPICDYVWHMKYETRREFDPNGVRTEMPPPQPNFSMNGRTAETLMAQVERWHRSLVKAGKSKHIQWNHSQIPDFRQEEGQGESKRTWTIVELVKSIELVEEGRRMKHCVSTYADSCAAGRSSIWSLRLYADGMMYWLVTLDVSHRVIVEARGKANRMPTPLEWRVIKSWATKNKLGMSSYLRSY